MKIKIMYNPYTDCAIEGLIFEAVINQHGAYGVKREDLYAQGVNQVFGHSEVVYFPAKSIVELLTVEVLEKQLIKAKQTCAQYYKWYQGACERIEKLKGELAHEKGKNSSSDTK